MKKEYHRWFSPSLGEDMELNVYGHAGKPVLVFQSSGGSYYEFEDFGMVGAVERFIDEGRIMLFTVGSADNESWLNKSVHPAERARRHNDYDAYIIHEVAPFIYNMSGRGDILATGCSLGGYHAMNFFLRHPDVFNAVIALSGCYQLSYFVGDYCDDNVYFNSPLLYLPNCSDPWFINRYRNSQIIACCGRGAWEDEMIHDTGELSRIFREKDIPAWCDFWGTDVNHDWNWWRVQLPYFLDFIV
ncbi:MAG: esterase family protein [Proteobacteria bacterium]|nr:esterase family protein [Pseudomonadota bacterium]